MRNVLAVICVSVLTGMATARTLTYDAAVAGPWSEADSWVERTVPVTGDDVRICGRASLTDADAEIAALVSKVLVEAEATLVISNDYDLALNGFVCGAGGVVKLGTGLLDYRRNDITYVNSITTDYQLQAGLVISNGTVRFPENGETFDREWRMGPIAVYAPGVLDLPRNCFAVIDSPTGDGTILNSDAQGRNTQLRFTGASVFDGCLKGDCMRVYMRGDVTFTCPTSTISHSEFSVWGGGRMTFPSFGRKGEPSPTGLSSYLKARDQGGTIRYTGTGETTDKDFMFSRTESAAAATMDAGSHGGVRFEGDWTLEKENIWNKLYLTGDNAEPMTIAGSVFEYSKTTDYIIKTGSGTWRFADTGDNASKRQQKGVYDVRDGVLQFDSVANAGQACALGPQTWRVSQENAYDNLADTVDYFFLLGMDPRAVGTLEYMGPQNAQTDRAIGVAGRGRLRTATGSGSLAWNGGAFAMGSVLQESELVLDGTDNGGSTIGNLRDGADKPLSVTKEGPGSWTLGTGCTFSGKLTVKEGTLNLSPPKGAFTWFKWTIRETGGGRQVRQGGERSADTNIGAKQLAFYDAEGNNLSLGTFTEVRTFNVATLQPGEMTYDGDVIQTFYPGGNPDTGTGDTGRNLNRLIDGKATEWLVDPRTKPQRADKPDSWISIVFRFPDTIPEVASYDVYSYVNNSIRAVCDWQMYGSDNGTTWYLLDEQTVDPAKNGWFSGAQREIGATRRAGENDPAFALEDVEDVSDYGIPQVTTAEVAPGAVLSTGRENLVLPLPSVLTVEKNGRYGAYRGFSVPEQGTFNVPVYCSWFRLTVKETVDGRSLRNGGTTVDQNVQMQEFALYDAKGVRRNCSLTVDPRCQPASLEPGFVTYDRIGYNAYYVRDADKLFDDAITGENGVVNGWCINFGKSPRLDDPTTWIQLTMRLPDTVPQITSYDWVSTFDPDSPRTPLAFTLESSPDGVRWIPVGEQVYETAPAKSVWASDGTPFAGKQCRTGYALDLSQTPTLVTLEDFSASIDLSGCVNVGNLQKWTVTVNDVVKPNVKLVYRNGALEMLSARTLILIR